MAVHLRKLRRRIHVRPDGYLYGTTGDARTPDLAQDRTPLNGKGEAGSDKVFQIGLR
ncbi:PQQ-dependent sugar dehydrogenase [Streptomyces sp. NBC_00400]|uniref:hypothetical protein n=1 Tax=Streptomyces sp. NBC_00400 TaxID=2975737 RepID=UPI002E215FC8